MKPSIDIERIASALAAAAVDSSQWGSAMEAVAKYTGSYGAALFPARGHMPYVFASNSMEESFDVYMRNHWASRDERYRGADLLVRDGVFTDRDISSIEDRKKSPFYQEFLASCQLSEFAGVRVGDRSYAWCLSIQRRAGQEPFSKAELNSLRYLSNRLNSVAETARALAFGRGEAALESFEFSSKAALLLDRGGNVVRTNASADRLLGTDIQIQNKRLVSCWRAATAQLELAIRELIWTTVSPATPPVIFPRQNGGPFIIYPMRLRGVNNSPMAAFHVILIIADTDAQFAPLSMTLQAAFDLTPAEARLAAALANGTDLGHFATETGLAKETARNQLKKIFQKTGTNRQPELTAILSRFLSGR
jgi:DNA-binding CsgD family transcriptional regulator